MSARQLSEQCSQLGYPIPRSVLTNLENGRRESVSVAELLVLAYVLKVPPLLLAFPVGRQELIEVLPGREVPTWLAAKWFTGEEALVVEPSYNNGELAGWAVTSDDLAAWDEGAAPVQLARDHDRICARWYQLSASLANAADASVEYRQAIGGELRRVEAMLAPRPCS